MIERTEEMEPIVIRNVKTILTAPGGHQSGRDQNRNLGTGALRSWICYAKTPGGGHGSRKISKAIFPE